MAKCEISGKSRGVGNNVSHANNRTRRTFGANIQKVKIVDETGTVRRAKVSTKVLKSNQVMKAPPRRVMREMAKAEEEKG